MRKDIIRRWNIPFFQSIDWMLLLFLLLFLDVKLVVKLLAIIFIYILRSDFRFGFSRRNSRLPLFYIGIILLACLNWLVYGHFTDLTYDLAWATGIFFWVLCLLAIHQIKLSVERTDPAILHRTLILFFLINAAVSLGVLLKIVLETGAPNPYNYQGGFQKYFISTGDYIRGVTMDTSTTNALINAMGVVYFLSRKQLGMVVLSMIILLLTGSNLTNGLLTAVLVWMFFFQSDRDRKSMILCSLFLLILFMARVSPQNHEYVVKSFKSLFRERSASILPARDLSGKAEGKPDSLLNREERRYKIAIHYLDSAGEVLRRQRDSLRARTGVRYAALSPLPRADINTPPYQHRDSITPLRMELTQFSREHGLEAFDRITGIGSFNGTVSYKWPGKLIAIEQTAVFLVKHPLRLLTGNGMGSFSSKLAFRVTGLGIGGAYPARFRYIDTDFLNNHLGLYLYYFSKPADLHSVINTPDNVYDQLLAEYGLAGLALFVFFYLGFFTKNRKRLVYSIPLVFIMLGAFFFGYWFEQLSIVVLFELFLLLDGKQE